MSRSDDRTKLMPKSADKAGGADDQTRAMPSPSTDDPTRAMPPASGGPPAEKPAAPESDDATRTVPVDEPPGALDDRTRMLGTTDPDDATAIVGAGGAQADDPTMALPPGATAKVASEALEDDVTIVRPQAQRRPRLLVRGASGDVEEHALDAGEVTVGRASSCTLVLANPEVSRKHARIVTGPTGSVLYVEGARRNTTVNGELMEGERVLKHGDVLELASERVVFAETGETPSFEGEEPGAAAGPRSLAVPIIGAVAVAALGLGAYLLGTSARPPTAPPAVPGAIAVPAGDPEAQAAAAADAAREAAREAAAKAVRDVAAQEAAAQRVAARVERIGKLLYEGDIALLENRLTTPTDGSAFYAYNEVLKLDPENEHARTKIVEILETYLGWAESAKARGQHARARLYADKAAYIRAEAPSVGDGPALDQRIAALGGGTR